MPKKTVIRADLIGKKCKTEILSTVAKLEGIKSMDIDPEKCTLTVVGEVDPVCIVLVLKKACFAATIVSVEDVKPPEKKNPCQELCEEVCKEACEKGCIASCYYNPCALPNGHYYNTYRLGPSGGYFYYEDNASGQCIIQ